MMCVKCGGITGWLFLIVGLIMLLQDFGVWSWWTIQPWTVLFLIIGLAMWGHGHCADCREMSGTSRKRK